jgi:hypothetical protein
VKDTSPPSVRGPSVQADWRKWLPHRLQFLHKVGTIEEMVEDAGKDFRVAADELATGLSMDPGRRWDEIDADHHDLNTCLRETIVLL